MDKYYEKHQGEPLSAIGEIVANFLSQFTPKAFGIFRIERIGIDKILNAFADFYFSVEGFAVESFFCLVFVIGLK
jgi:hypothetical protein